MSEDKCVMCGVKWTEKEDFLYALPAVWILQNMTIAVMENGKKVPTDVVRKEKETYRFLAWVYVVLRQKD